MSGPFTKLYARILDSSVWFEDDKTVRAWFTFMALADENGVVSMAPPILAKRANISPDELDRAIAKFTSPDPYSRNPENEGRRLARIDGGWLLLNHRSFREARSAEARKEQNRQASRNYREKSGSVSKNADGLLTRQHASAKSAKADTDTEVDTEAEGAGADARDAGASPPVDNSAATELRDPPAQAALALDLPEPLERPKAAATTKPKPPTKTGALAALVAALGAEAAARQDAAPQLSLGLGRKAAQRVAEYAAAQRCTTEHAAGLLVASWAALGNGNAWKLCDVPFRATNAPAARASPFERRQQAEGRLAELRAELNDLEPELQKARVAGDADWITRIETEMAGIRAEMRDVKREAGL